MSCSKHFLGFHWKRHDWEREVTLTESFDEALNDMWGRQIDAGHVVCRTRYVCRECGAIRDEVDCSCPPERADACAIRLEWLAKQRMTAPAPPQTDGAQSMPQATR